MQSLTTEAQPQLISYPTRIGILGGTFNPVHAGHIDLAGNVYHEFNLSRVMLLLTGNPPHKDAASLAPAQDRLNMLLLAANNYPFLDVSNLELSRSGVIYTVDTLLQLTAKLPNGEFYFVIGSDTLFELESWKSIAEVFRLTNFICVQRPGGSLLQIMLEIDRLNNLYGDRIKLSKHTGIPVSSSEIREAIKKGRHPVTNLPKEVEDYIIQYGLYK
ncbi:MAG: nicotinate-nucleotide adenylyltransferase [Eubacteriales bacterium]